MNNVLNISDNPLLNKLNSDYKLYFHDPNSYNWKENSYVLLCPITTIECFWSINSLIECKINLGMFFLMKENIFPLWDSIDNIDGGSFSFKILKSEVLEYWIKICALLLSEKFLKDTNIELGKYLNGVSISPKKNFCIIKIWLKKNDIFNENNIKNYFNIPENYNGDIIFKKHSVNIIP
jgi:hypothetical protein